MAILAVSAPAAGAWEAALDGSRVSAGLCVVVAPWDAALAARLGRNPVLLVHWLLNDETGVAAARSDLEAGGLYGKVSVEAWTGPELPYADNLVSLLLVAGTTGPAQAERLRVLRPGGEIIELSSQGTVERRGKGRPAGMGDWTHWRHAADRNPVSRDRLVELPRRIQWLSIHGREGKEMVTADGRCFYLSGTTLHARDAFNGLPLWSVPANGKSQVVTSAERVYSVSRNRLVCLEAASGKEIWARPEAGKAAFILLVPRAGRGPVLVTGDSEGVRALSPEDGRTLWTYPARSARGLSAGDGAVFLLTGDLDKDTVFTAAALDLETGKPRWEKSDLPWARSCYRSSCGRGMVAFEVGKYAVPWKMVVDKTLKAGVHFLSARDGRTLRYVEYKPAMRHDENARAFFLDAGVALHRLERQKGVSNIALYSQIEGEPEVFPALPPSAQYFYCYPPVATERFFIYGQMSFTDWQTHSHEANPITRGTCGPWSEGIIPANGMIYVFPKDCNCFSMLHGAAALAPAYPSPPSESHELVKGPAYGAAQPTGAAIAPGADWPILRGDAYRSGSNPTDVPVDARPLWTASLATALPAGPLGEEWAGFRFSAGPITPPVIAGGLVVVAQPQAHRVVALGADDGKVRWQFVANGRVDSPPTLAKGLCLFGCRSGWVYCLRLADGSLVWRLRAAPSDQRIVHCGQVESPWPVPGSVLVDGGVAYFTAGLHPLADGGLLAFAVDAATGSIRWKQTLIDMEYDRRGWHGRAGLEQDYLDLMVKDGSKVAMSRWIFDPATGQNEYRWQDAFYRVGEGGAYMQRGTWSYGYPMNRPRMHRPLLVARGQSVLGANRVRESPSLSLNLFRRDFKPGESFNVIWSEQPNDTESRMGVYFPANRIAQNVTWTQPYPGWIEAMVWAGDRLFLCAKGKLRIYSTADGRPLGERDFEKTVWDGLAAANGRLYVSTMSGKVVCLGSSQ